MTETPDYLDLLAKAIMLAACAHVEQRDLCKQPYILHPIRVMLACDTDEERIVAILHDTVEDTPITLKDIADAFPQHIVDAVDAISKRKGETYWENIARVEANPLALAVKLHDLEDNASLARLQTGWYREKNPNVETYVKTYRRLLWVRDNREKEPAGT